MKKPEDYGSIIGLNEEQYNALIEKIKLVQKESYNDALDDAIDNAIPLVVINRVIIDKESILKLKKL